MPRFKDSFEYVIGEEEWKVLAPMLANARVKYIPAWQLECALLGSCPLWDNHECISSYAVGHCRVILWAHNPHKAPSSSEGWNHGSYACGPRFVYRYMLKELVRARKELRKNGKTTDDRQIPNTPQDHRGVQAGA